MERTIIHLDMDAFFASVEVRDNPKLKGKPLIIGALPHERGVVSTCSYEARKFGVHSAMNIKEAYRRCPHGIYMHGDMRKYQRVSEQIHKIMLQYTDMIEFVALDEGYMDVTGSMRLFGSAEEIGRRLKKEIFDTVGVTCSVGISYSMMGAKLASEEKKPDGFFVIPDRDALTSLIKDRPVDVICGIGQKTTERLKSIGISTVSDLLAAPPAMIEAFGKTGYAMLKLAKGEDDRQVVADSVSKSIGREHTFQTNIDNKDVLKDALLLLSKDVSLRAKNKGLYGRTVTLKLKFCDMHQITRSNTVSATNSSREIYRIACEMLDKLRFDETVRLVGVTLGNLQDSKDEEYEQFSLFDEIEGKTEDRAKNEALENAIFDLHTRYGGSIIKTAKELEIHNRIHKKEE